MKMTDEFDTDEIKSGLSLSIAMAGVLCFMALIVAVVCIANKDQFTKKKSTATTTVTDTATEEEEEGYALGTSTLVSDDLDFWNMYKTDDEEEETQSTADKYAEKFAALTEEAEEETEAEEDLSEGGTKTEVILPDGSSLWVMINSSLEKNTYDMVGLVSEDPFLRYYSDGKKISKQGITIDDTYENINFTSVKNAGVDYVMIRVGRRGYATGTLTIDETAIDNMVAAKAAGLMVGVYFYSMAIDETEALEEANAVIETVLESGIELDFPVAFYMEYISNDSSRTENLTKTQLSIIAKTFCSTIENAGYESVIYGSKYLLLRRLDLAQLTDYSVWISQVQDVPDYPYQYTMWEYNQSATVSGVTGEVSMSISFIDYSMR